MLGNHYRRQVLGQGGQHLHQGLDTTGAGANGDQGFLHPADSRRRPHRQNLIRSQLGFDYRQLAGRAQCFNIDVGGHLDLRDDVFSHVFQGVGYASCWFADKIHSPQFQRLHGGVGIALGQAGKHDHRHGTQAHEIAQKCQAIHFGHFNIQGDDVGVELFNLFPGRIGVHCGTDDLNIGVAAENLRQQAPNQSGVIDYQHLDLIFTHCAHSLCTAAVALQ